MEIDFSKNKSYCIFEKGCIKLVKYLAKNQFLKYKDWESIDLIPSIERHILILLLNDKTIFKKLVGKNERIDIEELSSNISKFNHKTFLNKFLIRKIIDTVKYPSISHFEKYNGKDYIVFIHHPKYINIIKSSGISGEKVIWVAVSNYHDIKKKLGDKEDVISLPQGLKNINHNSLVSPIIQLAKKIRIILQIIKPKYSFFCEGDAPYNSLVSEVSNSLEIKSICIQWGIFPNNKKRVGFSNINSSYFFAWGNYFAKELETLNPKLQVKIYGYPNKDFKLISKKKSRKIIFLGQSYGYHITKKMFDDFIFIMIEVSKSLKDFQIVYRPHPSPHPEAKFSDIKDTLDFHNIIIDKSNNLFDHLKDSLISVGILTSALLEAILLDSIPVSYNPTCTNYPINFNKLEIGISNKYKYKIIDKLIELANNPDLIKYFQKQIIQKKEEFFYTEQNYNIPEFIDAFKL